MSTITLKDIPAHLHRALKQQAKAHGRSLNKEILHRLESNMTTYPVDAGQLLEQAALIREQIGGWLTDADLKKFKSEGRP